MFHKGWHMPIQARERIREALKGRQQSPELRQKHQIALNRPETRKKISEGVRKHDAEHPRRQTSPETREKLRKIMKRPEMKARILEGVRRYRATHPFPTGPQHPRWKGRINDNGYVLIKRPEHHRARKSGYVREHIVIWEKANGRLLSPDWVIHHINGLKADNRPENLIAVPKVSHHTALVLQAVQRRIRQLEAENQKLRAQGGLWA